jgi:hypothetical protein
MLMSGIELIEERLGPGVMPLRFTTGALAVLKPVADGRLLCVGASTGELGGSVSGVVGLEDSWPPSLKTRSNMEEVRCSVDCGEPGPLDAYRL